MQKKPEGLGPGARFGSGFGLEDEIRGVGWILDGNQKDGYTLYLDLNVNGDLSDDPPLRFEKQDAFTRTFTPRHDGSSPGLMRLSIVQQTRPGEFSRAACLRLERLTMRRGSLHIGGRELTFGLIGTPGTFGAVVFDLNGDGKLDLARSSPEYFDSSERFVRWRGTDYEFLIDRAGYKLQLKPVPGTLSEAQILRPGYTPPDFTVQGLDGRRHRLSDHRGKVVLLDFWMINCGWCQEGIPAMVDAYRKLHPWAWKSSGLMARTQKPHCVHSLPERT